MLLTVATTCFVPWPIERMVMVWGGSIPHNAARQLLNDYDRDGMGMHPPRCALKRPGARADRCRRSPIFPSCAFLC
jgi:hypothetical protein